MEEIKFSHNWNGKLYCTCFTSIRLRNDKKYQVNREFELLLKGVHSGVVVCSSIVHFRIADLNDYMAMLDTGYNKQDATRILMNMYKNIVKDWNTQQFSLILFRRLKPDVSQITLPTEALTETEPIES